jgi:hypothetical protein
MFDKRVGPFSNSAGVQSWSRTRALIVILNLATAASFYLVPLIFGYAWNNSAGPSILNVRQEDRRYPATNITAEPWGASVLLGPAESRLREYFSGRHLPLWNPYQGLGEPYAAQADGSPYSLPTLARALLPSWAGNLITFGVFAIGAAGMFAFLGLLGLSNEIRLFGAIAVFLSTALTFHIARYNIADQNALIPIQFAVTTWAIQKRTPLTYLALAAVTGITMTAGFVQSAFIATAITSLFGLALTWIAYKGWRERALVVSAVIAATLVGVALSAPFWLPIAELANVGYHKNVPSVVVYRPPPYNLAAFFLPALFGDTLVFTSLAGTGILVDWHNLFATSSAVVLLLCLIGLFACKWDDRGHHLLFWFALTCVTILALRFMHWPPFSLLSHDTALAQQTTKHTQAIAAFLALLAAMLALEHYGNWVRARLKWVCIGFVSIPVIVFCFAEVTSGDPIGALASLQPLPLVVLVNTVVIALVCAVVFRLSQQWVASPVPLFVTVVGVIICAELTLYLPLGTGQWWISCVRLLLGVAWVSAGYLVLVGRHIIAGALAAVIIVCYSMIIAVPKQGLPDQVYNRILPTFAEFLRTRIGNDYRSFGIFPNFSSQAMVRDIGVVGPFAPSGFAAFMHAIDPKGQLGFYGSSVFLLAGPASWRLDLNRYVHYRPVFDWLGVRYLVLEKAVLGSDMEAFGGLPKDNSSSFKVAFNDDSVTILESLKSRRRFEFSSSLMILRSQFAVIRQLQSDPSIVDRSVLVESWAADAFLEELAAKPDALEAGAEMQLVEESPNYLRLKLNSSRNGVFVVKDSYFPGWEAFVDGAKAPILRVNGMVRGVEIVSPGVHVVEFRYRPLSFWYGVFAGLVAFTLFVVLLFWHTANPRTIEVRLAPLALICVLLVAAGPAIVIPTKNTTLQLGKHERAIGIDLRNVALKWRETDSRNGRELFTRAVRFARLPVAIAAQGDIPLHIGDLVYLPNTGLAEIDDRGGFREVAAVEGTIVPLCRLFETTDKKSDGAALYQRGRWQILPQAESASSSRCMSPEHRGQ